LLIAESSIEPEPPKQEIPPPRAAVFPLIVQLVIVGEELE